MVKAYQRISWWFIPPVPSEEIPNYISVYGLRTYGQIENRLVSRIIVDMLCHNVIRNMQVTEIVYVHSKCMIVDDRYTIIGSGERMEGDREKSRLKMIFICSQYQRQEYAGGERFRNGHIRGGQGNGESKFMFGF